MVKPEQGEMEVHAEQFRSLVEISPDAIGIFSPEGRILYANAAAAQMLGLEGRESLIGRSILDFMPPEQSARYTEWSEQLLRDGFQQLRITPARRADGTSIDLEVRAALLSDGGEPVFSCIVRDVTERTRAAEAIAAGNRLNRTLLDSLPCNAMLIQPATCEVMACNAPAALLGVRPGERCFSALAKRTAPCAYCRMAEAWAAGEERRCEVEIEGRIWQIHWRPVSEHLCLDYACDVTEQRQAEQRIAAMESQLRHATRLAAMGELMAGLAHEVNQPVCTIVNFAKACRNLLARPEPDLALLREWHEGIADAAARTGEIVRRFRDFARPSADRRRSMSVGQLIEESLLLVRFETQKRKVAVEHGLAAPEAIVQVDPVQIQQVLVNLLLNALEAFDRAPVPEPRVKVSADRCEDGVELCVADNGPGVPEEELPRLFEPFFTTKSDGLGLGLIISRTIVEAHGGRLWVTRTRHGGASFHFVLPTGSGELSDVAKSNSIRSG